MTYNQFWKESIYLAGYYIKAHRLKMQRQNNLAYLSGMYNLAAINSCLPGGSRYPEEPFKFGYEPKEDPAIKEAREKKEAEEKMIRYLNAFIPPTKRVI